MNQQTSRKTTRAPVTFAAHATAHDDPLILLPHVWSGRLLIIGGLLMISMYVMEIVFGLQYGRMPDPGDLQTSWFVVAQSICFALGLLLTGTGLTVIGRTLRPRAPIISTIGMVFACIATITMLIHLLLIIGWQTLIGELGGLGVLANLSAATLLGIAVLRKGAFSRASGWMLLTVGLITFPCILLTIPLETVLPAYMVGDLPFPVWGLVFAMLGGMLLQRQPDRVL